MHLAVFGATGQLGRHVTEQALARDWTVRAHVRTPDKLGPLADRVDVVAGDLADADSIAAAVAGVDAVVSSVGHARGQDPAVYGDGMRAIVAAMGAHGVRRLVAISGAGLELPGDTTTLGRRIIITLLQLTARRVLEGKQREWAALDGADVDWTLVRVARMVDRPASGGVAVDLRAVSGSPMVAYPDVAAWMLDRAADAEHVHEAPFVSGG